MARSKATSVPKFSAAGATAAFNRPDLPSRAPSLEQVREQVERIFRSPALSRPTRTRSFLQYIVEQTLSGHASRLKQYSIATEALGRDSGFNPDTDPVVRLEASKLRRALEDYYLRAGSNDPIRITVPKGTYVPTFEFAGSDNRAQASNTSASAEASFHSHATALSTQRLLVLPFCNKPHTELGQGLTNGLFEQLVVELARYRDVSVVTPENLENGSDGSGDPIGAGMRMQARFVVSGSVRQNGEQIRITARLHDVRAGSIIWIDCFDLQAQSSLGLQTEDNIARHIAGAVADFYGVIAHALSLQSVYSGGNSWNLQDAIHRHQYLARTLAERVYRIARADLEIGSKCAPYHPMIWAALGHTIFYGNVLGFDEDENWMTLVYRYAQRSFELDHKCAFGHVVMALHALYQREFGDVFETCKRILQDNPHAPSTKLSAGFFRALAGDWENGSEMLNSALSLLLHPPGWAYRVTFLNQYRKGNYIEALHEISKYHAPENFTPSLLRAAALAQLGRIDEASMAVAEVMRICPRFQTIAPRYLAYLVSFDDICAHLKDGLYKAGLDL